MDNIFWTEHTHYSGYRSMFMLFLLRPPTKPCYCDVMTHALYFLSRERDKTFRRERPTCDENRGEGKGEMIVHAS